MIVVDASAMVEALVGRDVDETLLDALAGEVAAPHLLDVEVLSVLRGLVLGRKLAEHLAGAARSHHFEMLIHRREALRAPLHTCDVKLDSGGHNAVVHLHGQTH